MTLLLDQPRQWTTVPGPFIARGERRRGLRIRQAQPVKVLDANGGKYYSGTTRDISSTGLRIELPAHALVHVGDLMSLHVGLASTGATIANRNQMVPVRVVWVNQPHPRRRMVVAGVEICTYIDAQLDAA